MPTIKVDLSAVVFSNGSEEVVQVLVKSPPEFTGGGRILVWNEAKRDVFVDTAEIGDGRSVEQLGAADLAVVNTRDEGMLGQNLMDKRLDDGEVNGGRFKMEVIGQVLQLEEAASSINRGY
ncbi:hypothetical protein M422DRAFT_239015 [Sphaerobolus stellatus SS14]|nr:hypothetical protein M422DRAFT_239015 [Sphaerobolus stellatus SS14]